MRNMIFSLLSVPIISIGGENRIAQQSVGVRKECKNPITQIATFRSDNPQVTCAYQGLEDGIPMYEICLGKRLLLRYYRSAVVLNSTNLNQIAINDYDGSSFSNCYIIWDKKNPGQKMSLEKIFRSNLKIQQRYKSSFENPEHEYYGCEKWAAHSIGVVAELD